MRKAVVSALLLFAFACPAADLRAADVKEPFGMDMTAAPETSMTWQEWKKIIAAADIEIQKLEKCRAEKNCNVAEEKYSVIVNEARPKEPYPKVEFVQVRINHAGRGSELPLENRIQALYWCPRTKTPWHNSARRFSST